MALDLSALDDAPLSDTFGKPGVPSGVAPRAPLSQFVEDENQPRTEFSGPEWADFKADIAEHGVLQPIIVVVQPDGKLKIRFGARRYRACCELGLVDAPYVATEDPRQMDDYSQVSENEQRKPLQPLELATFIAKKLKGGAQKKEVAAKLRIDPSAVTHLMTLIDAPDFMLELYHSGKCRAPHYLYELRKLHLKGAEIVERRCAQADVVDKALLNAISAEIEPPSIPESQGTGNIRDVMDNPASGNAGGGSGLGAGQGVDDSSTGGSAGASEDGPKVKHLPSHNPDIEKDKGGKADDPTRLKKPLLLAKYKGRDVMVVLTQRPSTEGMVLIRFEDGSGEEEVVIGDVILTLLTEARG